jgi:hypothetical protein
MRASIRSSVIAGIAVAAVAVTPLALPPESTAAPSASHDVRLTASPALGAIPAAFIRNQFEYCSLICPYAVQGAITVPIAAVQAPATFFGSLASTGTPLKAIGAALASVTGPANAAATPLFNNDVFLVVPKAFHALDVAIVEAFNVGAAVLTPGELLQTVQNARTNILGALDQPVGPPTTPTGARNILQVVTVEAVNVVTAVAFQAGELLLLGVIQTADAVAQELAQSSDPGAALSAGAAQAGKVVNQSAGIVTSAVDTAVTNIRNSLNDPFPSPPQPEVTSTAAAVVNDKPVKPDSNKPTEKRSDKKDSDSESEFQRDASREVPREANEQTEDKPKDDSQSDRPGKPDHDGDKKREARASDQSAAGPSAV